MCIRDRARPEDLARVDRPVRDRRGGRAEERPEAAGPERHSEHLAAAFEHLDLVPAGDAVHGRAPVTEREVHVRVGHDQLPVGLAVIPGDDPVALDEASEVR